MQEFLLDYYFWLKSIHLIAVISWLAGLLYLPRLFVYHATAEKGSELSETFKIMERRLLRIIMNPAMIIAWVFGGLMLYADNSLFEQAWMHVKLLSVSLMTIMHHIFAKWFKAFVKDENKQTEKIFRIANEVPTILMIIIVIMAIAKPF